MNKPILNMNKITVKDVLIFFRISILLLGMVSNSLFIITVINYSNNIALDSVQSIDAGILLIFSWNFFLISLYIFFIELTNIIQKTR